MNITLKNIKTFRGHDGIGLNADIYVDGKKVCHVHDDARGGCFDYTAYGPDYQANNKIIGEMEEYAKTLPPVKSSFDDSTYPQDLDGLINDIVMKQEIEKMEKKNVTKFPTHIIVGVPGSGSYTEYGYGKPKVLLSQIPVANLQRDIDTIKAKLKDGAKILNTNLEALGIVI